MQLEDIDTELENSTEDDPRVDLEVKVVDILEDSKKMDDVSPSKNGKHYRVGILQDDTGGAAYKRWYSSDVPVMEEGRAYQLKNVQLIASGDGNAMILMRSNSEVVPTHKKFQFEKVDIDDCPGCGKALTDDEFHKDGRYPQHGYEYWECNDCGEVIPKRQVSA